MPLKLTVEKGDQVLVGEDCIVTVNYTGGRPQLEFAAPPEIKIIHIKADKSKQWMNRQREAAGLPKSGSPRFNKES